MKRTTERDATLSKLAPRTRLAVAGRDPFDHHGYVNTPVYHASTLLYPTAEDFLARRSRYKYGRRGTPTSEALEDALRHLEGEACAGVALLPSGLAAVSAALLAVLRAGDHLLMTDSAYEPTRVFCDRILSRYDIAVSYYDPLVGAGIAALMQPNTRAVFVESPGSLSFEVQDIPVISEVAHAHGARVLMDNTWATPLYFPALARGVDLAIQSGTKYIGGHSDVMIGAVAANADLVRELKETVFTMGLCVGPDDMYLALRGLRTLSARLAVHQEFGPCGRPLARRPSGGARRPPPRARIASGTCHLETRFLRRERAVISDLQAGSDGRGPRFPQCADPVRHRRVVGRLRKPRHPLRLHENPHRNPLGAGRSDCASAYWA